ncbi:MAG: HU family DNA-binding protein [Treponema sp.]|jgi:DNA-binding protein HU-beta|nr:HU family DNA-binding protein [Treponema sp.]
MTGKFTRTNIQEILRGSGLNIIQAREAATKIIYSMADSLASGEVIELRGLGTLEQRERKARVMHNPRTMAAVNVPARSVIFFKPSEKLKIAINQKEVSM